MSQLSSEDQSKQAANAQQDQSRDRVLDANYFVIEGNTKIFHKAFRVLVVLRRLFAFGPLEPVS